MSPSAQVHWFLDPYSYGGVVSERVLAALPLADNLWCGLLLTFDSPGAPRIQFWDRIDDLERQGFQPIRPARARAICDALPRFLDRLEQWSVVSGQASEESESPEAGGGSRAGVSLC